MKKTILKINKLIAPIYLYFILFLVYRFTIPHVSSKLWSDVMLYSIALGLPVIFTIWLNIRLRKIEKNKVKYAHIFAISLLPGFFPGALVGYAFWAFGHGDTILGFLDHILFFGLPTGITFGLICLLIELVIRTFGKRKS